MSERTSQEDHTCQEPKNEWLCDCCNALICELCTTYPDGIYCNSCTIWGVENKPMEDIMQYAPQLLIAIN